MAQQQDNKSDVERSPVLRVLRSRTERAVGGKIIFEVAHYQRQGNWAFILGYPKRPGGKEIDWSRSRLAEAWRDGAFDDNVIGLLRKQGNRWKLAAYVIGATDVPYVCWWKQYKAPKSIFDYTEECNY